MADTKITSLTEKVGPLSGIEELASNDATADRKILTGVIRGWPGAQIPYFTDATQFLTTPLVSTAALALAADRLYMVPIIAPQTIRTFVTIRAICTTGHASNMRIGIYSANQDTCKPTTLLAGGSADIDMTATGQKDETISQALVPGVLYFLAYSSGGTPTVASCAPAPMLGVYLSAGTAYGAIGGLRRVRTHGAFVDETASTWTPMGSVVANSPLIGIR